MSFIAKNPEHYKGKVVGTGQCVSFVQKVANCPVTASWKQGKHVKGATIPEGTAIATFVSGKYPNLSHGNHAAIYVEQNDEGIVVWDQWKGQSVHKRTLRFKGMKDKGSKSNNGDWFYVIES